MIFPSGVADLKQLDAHLFGGVILSLVLIHRFKLKVISSDPAGPGMIGGLGPESTVDYYRSIIARFRALKPDGDIRT